MEKANCIFADETCIIVLCPFCDKLHRHGTPRNLGESRVSHCQKGEYTIGEVFSDDCVRQALKTHQRGIEAKRRARREAKAPLPLPE